MRYSRTNLEIARQVLCEGRSCASVSQEYRIPETRVREIAYFVMVKRGMPIAQMGGLRDLRHYAQSLEWEPSS